MIDGLKIQCNYLNYEKWTKNEFLSFPILIDEETAEIINRSKTSHHKGLLFRLTPTHDNNFYKTITGSLHKYFNDGLHNANDFSMSDIQKVIKELQEKFSIQPEKSELNKLEIGINIELPISVKEFLKMIVGLPTKRFSEMNINKPDLGKVCNRSEIDIKVYDKSKQLNLKINNLLRIELKIKKKRYLNKLGIYTLADLTNPEKIIKLHYLLYKTFSDILIYEFNIDENKLTDGQKIYLLRHTNPLNWERMTKQNRYNHKQRFNEFLQKHSVQKIKNFILDAIDKKTNELIDNLPKNPLEKKRQTLTFSQYKCSVKRSNPNNQKNKETEKQFCTVCNSDISHKRKHTKYCSRKCRNKANNSKRTKLIQEKRKKEILKLTEIKTNLSESNYNLLVFRKSETEIKQARKKQKDIKPLKYNELRKIIKVNVSINRQTFEFTTLRAKELIKEIYQLNYENIEKYKCLECNKEFIPKRKDAKYCSRICKNKSSNRTRDKKRKLNKKET